MSAATGLAASALLVSAAASSYQAYQANKARNDARKQARRQEQEADRLLQEQEAAQAEFERQQAELQDQQAAENVRVDERERRKSRQLGRGGRRSTILTDGLGQLNETTAEESAKTLLGL